MQQYTYLSWGRIVDRIGMAASRSEMRQSDSAHLKYFFLKNILQDVVLVAAPPGRLFMCWLRIC
jgi:hypothetical protein